LAKIEYVLLIDFLSSWYLIFSTCTVSVGRFLTIFIYGNRSSAKLFSSVFFRVMRVEQRALIDMQDYTLSVELIDALRGMI
jgi:hypothetical protein